MKEAVVYLLAIVAAEVATILPRPLWGTVNPLWGIIGHAVILGTLIVCSARTSDKPHQQLLLSLALVPLIRIINFSMILIFPNPNPIRDILTVYIPLVVATVAVMRNLGYSRSEVGLNFKSLPIQLGVVSTGLIFGWLEYLILKRPEAWITQLTWSEVLPPALILVAFTGFVEEFIFRGVLQRSAVESFGGWRGIVYVSLLFAIVHIIHYTEVGLTSILIDIAFVFGVAMFFGWVVKRTGSLLGVSLSHGITNIVLFLIAPFFF